MKNLRRNFERFCYNHKNLGIPNLMLYIAIGNVIVYFLTQIDPSHMIFSFLCFDRTAILHGQVWRLFSYIFTYLIDATGIGLILLLVSLLCYYQFGRLLEDQWGVFRFNLYYLCGLVLTDLGAIVFNLYASTTHLNLSLFLAVATLLPDLRFLVFFIIPLKAKYFAWVDLGFTLLTVLTDIRHMIFLHYFSFSFLFPILALANYFLFFGKDIQNLLPDSMRYRRPRQKKSSQPNPNWAKNYRSRSGEAPYRHKCTVCGKTDTQYPSLEFRYCSRCNGYYCYCMEHINNHVHIS